MLRYRKTEVEGKILYHKTHHEQHWRRVNPKDYAKVWEAEAKRIQRLFELEQAKNKALADDLEFALNQISSLGLLVKHSGEKALAQAEKYAKLTDKYCNAINHNIELKKKLSKASRGQSVE